MDRSFFIEEFRAELEMFIGADDVDEALKVSQGEKAFTFATLQRVLDTKIGSVLFADEGLKGQWLMYVEKSKATLADVIHLDLEEGCIADMTTVMKRTSAAMVAQGYARFEKKALPTSWCGWSFEQHETDIDDQWRLPLQLTVLACGLSQAQVTPFPWERHFMARNGNHMADYPSAVRDPSLACVGSHLKARKLALEILKQSGDDTYVEMVRTLEKHSDNLQRIDPRWSFHIDFAKHELPKLVRQVAESDVLALLPCEENNFGPSLENKNEIVKAMRGVEMQAFMLACPTAQEAISNGILVAKKIFDANPPLEREIASYSVFCRRVLVRCSNFLIVEPSGKIFGQNKKKRSLRGAEAASTWETIIMDVNPKKEELPLESLEEVRRFLWLFTADAQRKANEMTVEAAKRKRSSLQASLAVEDKPAAKKVAPKSQVRRAAAQVKIVSPDEGKAPPLRSQNGGLEAQPSASSSTPSQVGASAVDSLVQGADTVSTENIAASRIMSLFMKKPPA